MILTDFFSSFGLISWTYDSGFTFSSSRPDYIGGKFCMIGILGFFQLHLFQACWFAVKMHQKGLHYMNFDPSVLSFVGTIGFYHIHSGFASLWKCTKKLHTNSLYYRSIRCAKPSLYMTSEKWVVKLRVVLSLICYSSMSSYVVSRTFRL